MGVVAYRGPMTMGDTTTDTDTEAVTVLKWIRVVLVLILAAIVIFGANISSLLGRLY